MWVMRTVDTGTGQKIYGLNYTDWDHHMLRHGIHSTVLNRNGDEGQTADDLTTTGPVRHGGCMDAKL